MKFIVIVTALAMMASCSPKLSPDQSWGEQRWTVIEMRGVPVQQSGTRKDAFITFTPADKRFSGNGGCNRISGNYTLEKKNELRFGQVISTKMSCDDIAFETAFLSTLDKVNRFETNGNTMLLKDGNDVILILQSK